MVMPPISGHRAAECGEGRTLRPCLGAPEALELQRRACAFRRANLLPRERRTGPTRDWRTINGERRRSCRRTLHRSEPGRGDQRHESMARGRLRCGAAEPCTGAARVPNNGGDEPAGARHEPGSGSCHPEPAGAMHEPGTGAWFLDSPPGKRERASAHRCKGPIVLPNCARTLELLRHQIPTLGGTFRQ
jgi:hypothetical protein